jgi:sec-independent protein translocase protein TatA
MGLSVTKLLLILLIVLLVFGAGKVPKVMGDLAKGMRAFRDGLKEEPEEEAKRIKAEMQVPVSEREKVAKD